MRLHEAEVSQASIGCWGCYQILNTLLSLSSLSLIGITDIDAVDSLQKQHHLPIDCTQQHSITHICANTEQHKVEEKAAIHIAGRYIREIFPVKINCTLKNNVNIEQTRH